MPNYLETRYPDAPRAKNGRVGKIYTHYQYKLKNGQWSKPVPIGKKRFRSMLEMGLIDPAFFHNWTLYPATEDRNAFVRRNGRTLNKLGKEVIRDVKTARGSVAFRLRCFGYLDQLKAQRFTPDLYTFNTTSFNNRTAVQVMHVEFTFLGPVAPLSRFLSQNGNPAYFGDCSDQFYDELLPAYGVTEEGFGLYRHAFESLADVLLLYFDDVRPADVPDGVLDFHTAAAMRFHSLFFKSQSSSDTVFPLYPDDPCSFYPHNGCLYVQLMKTYKKKFDSLYHQTNNKHYQLSYSRLWEIANQQPFSDEHANDNTVWTASFDPHVRRIARFMRVRVHVLDFRGKLVCYYDPKEDGKSIDKNVHPYDFVYIWSNDHADVVNCFVKGDKHVNYAQHLKKHLDQRQQALLKVEQTTTLGNFTEEHTHPTNFSMRHMTGSAKPLTLSPDSFTIVTNIPELVVLYERYLEDKKHHTAITSMNMLNVFLHFRFQHKTAVQFQVETRGLFITRLQTFSAGSAFTIVSVFHPSTGVANVESVEDYLSSNEHLLRMKRSLLTHQFKSVYSPQVFSFFRDYHATPLIGIFDEQLYSRYDNTVVGYSDYNKYYPHCLMRFSHLPKLVLSDNFVPYNSEPLEDCSIYLTEKIGTEFCYPFYPKNLCLGKNLRAVPSSRYRITHVLRPSGLAENTFGNELRELYASGLPASFKKNIGNIVCGFFVQKNYNSHRSYFTSNGQEARYCEKVLGGRLRPIRHQDTDVGYMVSKTLSAPLLDGFYPIGLLIIDSSHLLLDRLLTDLRSCSLDPFAVRVDCVYHRNDPVLYQTFKDSFPHYFDYTDKDSFEAIGKLKSDTKLFDSGKRFSPKPFTATLHPVKTQEFFISNEWNDTEMMKLLSEQSRLLVIGYGGTGKSSTVLNSLRALGKRALVLTKTHPLCDDLVVKYGDVHTVMTAESFFHLNPAQELPSFAVDPSVLDGVYAVVLDDCLLCDLRVFEHLYFFTHSVRKKHPDLKFFATCDPYQLDMLLWNKFSSFKNASGSRVEILERFVLSLFPNFVRLRENKRLNSKQDRELFKEYVEIIRSGDLLAYRQFCRKHMNVVSDFSEIPPEILKSSVVISYRNAKIEALNSTIYALNYGSTPRFSSGHVVRAAVTVLGRFYKGQTFKVESFDAALGYTLRNTVKHDHTVVLRADDISTKMTYPYASTAHSWQGLTSKCPVVRVDFNVLFATLDYHYTADTRTTSFKNLWIVSPPNEENYFNVKHNAITCRVSGYLKQDVARFGFTPDVSRFVSVKDVEVLFIEQKGLCYHCSTPLDTQWLLDRINSFLPHYKNNVVLSCPHCNCQKHDAY